MTNGHGKERTGTSVLITTEGAPPPLLPICDSEVSIVWEIEQGSALRQINHSQGLTKGGGGRGASKYRSTAMKMRIHVQAVRTPVQIDVLSARHNLERMLRLTFVFS